MKGKKQFSKFRMLQIEEGKHVHVIYTFLLYRHERFAEKYRNYTSRKIHKNYIWDPRAKWFIFRNLTREFNDDVSSVYFPVKLSCLYNKKPKLVCYSLTSLVRKILFCHSKIKFISSCHRVISPL